MEPVGTAGVVHETAAPSYVLRSKPPLQARIKRSTISVAFLVAISVQRGSVLPREVYPNAPLRLVIAELRYPYAPRLSNTEILEDLTTRLRPTFPVPMSTGVQIVMAVGGGATQAPQGPANRFFSRDRTASVTIGPTNTVVEVSAYHEYGAFRPVLDTCLRALEEVRAGIVGLERIGLRYINEIRVPGLGNVGEWNRYLAPNFIAPLGVFPGQPIAVTQSVVQTEPQDHVTTLIRFGALRGQAVSSAGPLRVQAAGPTDPFFLLDIDNAWSSADAFDEDAFGGALDICDRLHAPIDELFESAITDELRSVFRSRS